MEEKQKSYGTTYKNITAKHKYSGKFWGVVICACVLGVVAIFILRQTMWVG